MTQKDLDFIKDAFSQIIDDIGGNPDWYEAARAVASDLGTLERELKEKVIELPPNLDEAAEEWVRQIMRISDKVHKYLYTYLLDAFRAGEEFHAKQGITKEAVIGMATENVEINVSQRVLDALDTCPGDKIRIQITKIE